MKYIGKRKLYWRELKNEINAENISPSKLNEIMDENGKMLPERWREYFKNLMNVKCGGPAVVTAVILSAGKGRVCKEESITYEEVNQAKKYKKMERQQKLMELQQKCWCGDVLTKGMVAWGGGVVPADWTKAITAPVYKGEGRRRECGSCRGISLLSIPRKVYGRVIIEKVERLTGKKISEEQGGFRKERDVWFRYHGSRNNISKSKKTVSHLHGSRKGL